MLQWWENLINTSWEQPWVDLFSYLSWRTCPSWRKDQTPMGQHWLCQTPGTQALPGWKQSYTVFKTAMQTKIPKKLQDKNDRRLLCAAMRPGEILPSAPSFQLQQSLPGCFGPAMNFCSSFLHKEVQIQPSCKFLLSKQTKSIITYPPQNFLQVSALQPHDSHEFSIPMSPPPPVSHRVWWAHLTLWLTSSAVSFPCPTSLT